MTVKMQSNRDQTAAISLLEYFQTQSEFAAYLLLADYLIDQKFIHLFEGLLRFSTDDFDVCFFFWTIIS